MKKVILFFTMIFVAGVSAFSDDARIRTVGGGAGIVSEKDEHFEITEDKDIAMVKELVSITLYDDYYTVDAKFWFKNYGSEKEIYMGFPTTKVFGPEQEFTSFINGKQVEIKKYKDVHYEDYDYAAPEWYVKTVHFDEYGSLVSQVKYSGRYGIINTGLYFGIDGWLPYIYGTGKSWKGPIGKITVDVKNLSLKTYIKEVDFLHKKFGTNWDKFQPLPKDSFNFRWISDDTFRIEADNVEPASAKEAFELQLHHFNYTNIEGQLKSNPGENPIYARVDFTKWNIDSDLCFYTKNQLRFARNDFYALHGRSFASKDVKDFYESIEGYTKNPAYSDSLLSDEENKLVQKIVQIEKRRYAPLGQKPHPDSVGDIVFTDGTATAYHDGLVLSEAQKNACAAVIFYKGTACSNDGRERLLGVGLVHLQEEGRLLWCDYEPYGFQIVPPIKCTVTGYRGDFTFTGDVDGSDNLEQIGAYFTQLGQELSESAVAYWYPQGRPRDDTANEDLYPVFYFAKKYADVPGTYLSGTRFEKGWYIPSIAELYQLWINQKSVDSALRMCGGDEIGQWSYISSTQFPTNDSLVYELYFYTGGWHGCEKEYHSLACAIREF